MLSITFIKYNLELPTSSHWFCPLLRPLNAGVWNADAPPDLERLSVACLTAGPGIAPPTVRPGSPGTPSKECIRPRHRSILSCCSPNSGSFSSVLGEGKLFQCLTLYALLLTESWYKIISRELPVLPRVPKETCHCFCSLLCWWNNGGATLFPCCDATSGFLSSSLTSRITIGQERLFWRDSQLAFNWLAKHLAPPNDKIWKLRLWEELRAFEQGRQKHNQVSYCAEILSAATSTAVNCRCECCLRCKNQ